MDDPYISRAEHEEFSRRLAEENKRQDKRIEMLEENVREMRALTNSVEIIVLRPAPRPAILRFRSARYTAPSPASRKAGVKAELASRVENGKISAEQYEEITGEVYAGE